MYSRRIIEEGVSESHMRVITPSKFNPSTDIQKNFFLHILVLLRIQKLRYFERVVAREGVLGTGRDWMVTQSLQPIGNEPGHPDRIHLFEDLEP